jgi:hypothetical protein
VRNISKKRPRGMDILASSFDAVGSGPGRTAETTNAAQMPATS